MNSIVLPVDEHLCYGCGACATVCPSQAISMEEDAEGFLYPIINYEQCTSCGLCCEVCTGVVCPPYSDARFEQAAVGARHKDATVLMSSSSGGVFTALAQAVLRKKGVVYGVRFSENMDVVYGRAATYDEILPFLGSKYIQADSSVVFTHIAKDLVDGHVVLFVGTPCAVAGLSSYLNKRTISTKNLLTVGLICHGVGSPLVWREYVLWLQKKSRLKSFTFRDKRLGWQGYQVRASFENCSILSNTANVRAYSNLYSHGLIMRPSCYTCVFSCLNRPSDITIGDLWGVERVLPEFDDNRGTSLVLVNTIKGSMWNEEVSEFLETREVAIMDCMQMNLTHPTFENPKRQSFWQLFFSKGIGFVIAKYGRNRLTARAIRFLTRIFR